MTTAFIDESGVIVRLSEDASPTEGETAIELGDRAWLEPGRWRRIGDGWEPYENPIFNTPPLMQAA